jgi:hypothetical protein
MMAAGMTNTGLPAQQSCRCPIDKTAIASLSDDAKEETLLSLKVEW